MATAKKQTIFRATTAEAGWFPHRNEAAQDERLSFDARGLLAYLLSKPKDWRVDRHELAKQGGIGLEKVRLLLHELKAAGYLTPRRKRRAKNGTWLWSDYQVHGAAKTTKPSYGQPDDGQPCHGSPSTVNRAILQRRDLTEHRTTEDKEQTTDKDVVVSAPFNANEQRGSTARLRGIGISHTMAQQLSRKFAGTRIEQVLDAAERNQTHNPAGWVIAALMGGWTFETKEEVDKPDYSDFIIGTDDTVGCPRCGSLICQCARIEQEKEREKWRQQLQAGLPERAIQNWEMTVRQLESQWDRGIFVLDTHMQDTILLKVDGTVHTIGCRDGRAQELLRHRFYRSVRRVYSDITGQELELTFVVHEYCQGKGRK